MHNVTHLKMSPLKNHFADIFFFYEKKCARQRYSDSVKTFKNLQADAFLYREIQCKTKDIFNFLFVLSDKC